MAITDAVVNFQRHCVRVHFKVLAMCKKSDAASISECFSVDASLQRCLAAMPGSLWHLVRSRVQSQRDEDALCALTQMMALLDNHLGKPSLPDADADKVEKVLEEVVDWVPPVDKDIIAVLKACRDVFFAAGGRCAKGQSAAQLMADAEHSMKLVREAPMHGTHNNWHVKVLK